MEIIPQHQRRQAESQPAASAPHTPSVTQAERRSKEPREFVALFAGITAAQVDSFIAQCTVAVLDKDEIVLVAGQQNASVFILLSGRLKAVIGDQETSEYVYIQAGECFGEMSVIEGTTVSAEVIADTACRMLIIDKEQFWGLLGQVPALARNLLAIVTHRMRSREQSALKRLHSQLELEHLNKELNIAADIQASLLPSEYPLFPDCQAVDLYAVMHPAKSIGGDFYDTFFVTPNKLFVAVGDVSGKGIAASLFMVQAIMHIKTYALMDLTPGEILARVNNSLCRNNSSAMFVTVFCGILDIDTGVFEYSSGGHNPPLSNALNGAFQFLDVTHGLLLGVVENVKYTAATLQLKPRDMLFIYTDGVTEADNREKQLFSNERLEALLRSCNLTTAKSTVDEVRAAIDAFSEGVEQADDITMLALRYFG